ncbi:hypothetical protein Arub01_04780 [Actinomadura rubrobrunea]|uniref:Uncharacterized protein n=1 Tax=Actinomadura rubrobrunea TaxID=115335 RepID=A0A9W6PPG3_9ACTN|nr:hypothetical protein [Actinomadura rubrobrunea]GLW62234.1 hypothetical protein Arub01_04780 [Actinomadura rubrobrunea]
MTVIKDVRAERGGRVVLSFGPDGFAADGETWNDALDRWARRLFGTKKLLIALGLAILLSFPAMGVVKALGESDAVVMAVGAPPLLLLLYFLVGVLLHAAGEALAWAVAIVSLPLLLIPAYRRWLFGSRPPLRERPGFVHAGWVAQAQVTADGADVAVTLHFTNGARARYTARGAAGRDLAARFRRLLGDRLVPR